MYKKIKEVSGGQALCPSKFRDGEFDLEKADKPVSNKKSYRSIILLTILFCGFMLIALLGFKIGHQTVNPAEKENRSMELSIEFSFDVMYNGAEKNSESNSTLPVEIPATLVKMMQSQFKKINDSIIGYTDYATLLKCDLELNVFDVYWYHNDKQIDTSNESKYKLHNGDLEIKNLTANDAGNYKCWLDYAVKINRASYNLEIQHAYKWVAEDSPEIKDPAYRKFSFNNEVNICRFHNDQYLVPCAIDQNIVTLIDIFRQKITLPHKVQILMINKMAKYDWIFDCDGHVPPKAVEAGHLDDGDKLYIGSTTDSEKLGMIQPSAEVMYPFIINEGRRTANYRALVIYMFI